MPTPDKLTAEEREKLNSSLSKRYEEFKSRNLSLDMTRGKPCPEQLDLSMGLLTCLDENRFKSESNMDCRNYGGIDGIVEAKRLFSEYLGVGPDEIFVGGFSLSPATATAIEHEYVDVVLEMQPYLLGYFGVAQIVLTKRYGFTGLRIDTGGGMITKENIDLIAPLAKRGIR